MKLKILALWPLQRTLTDPALGSAGLRRIVGRFLGTSWKRCPRLSPTVHWSHDPIALQGGWAMPSSWSSGERKQACGHTALSRHTCPPWLCTPSPRRPLHGGPLHGGPRGVGSCVRAGTVPVLFPWPAPGSEWAVHASLPKERTSRCLLQAPLIRPGRRRALLVLRSFPPDRRTRLSMSPVASQASPVWRHRAGRRAHPCEQNGSSLGPQGACRPAGDTGSEQRITNCANKSEMTTAN